MTKDYIYGFIREHKFGVLATVSSDNIPESAYAGLAVTPELNIIFGTTSDSRKYANLLFNAHIAFVIGWENKQTVQYEGIAKIPDDSKLDQLKKNYYAIFPDRRKPWENRSKTAFFVVKPAWIRFSDLNEPKNINEFTF